VTARTQVDHAGLLQAKGLRPTRPRLDLLEELAREPNDVTAQELWRRLRERRGAKVGLATVYRTLALLREHHIVDTLSHHGGELCYRLCSDSHHHHLVCRTCHRVVEFGECDIDDWVERISAKHGFAKTRHQLEIDGVCAQCSATPETA
jgi:Fur family ferric uptake transcriptional regulator